MQMKRAVQALQSWTSCPTPPPLPLTVPHQKCLHGVPAQPDLGLPLVPATDMLSEPLLCLQGPTSSGKTSLVAYLAAQTGHTFVRINNHEQTDLQVQLDLLAACMSEEVCTVLDCCHYGPLEEDDLFLWKGWGCRMPCGLWAHGLAEALSCCCQGMWHVTAGFAV